MLVVGDQQPAPARGHRVDGVRAVLRRGLARRSRNGDDIAERRRRRAVLRRGPRRRRRRRAGRRARASRSGRPTRTASTTCSTPTTGPPAAATCAPTTRAGSGSGRSSPRPTRSRPTARSGELLKAGGRGPMRPAHMHFKVTAAGYQTLDHARVRRRATSTWTPTPCSACARRLIAPFARHEPGTAPDGRELDVPYWTMHLRHGPGARHDRDRRPDRRLRPGRQLERAAASATYGVQNMVITKYRWTANTPRAHITNQRAVEIMRDMGLEDEIKAKGDAAAADGRHGVLHEPGRRRARAACTPGARTRTRLADYTLASPCIHYDLPQDIFEPIILGAGGARAAAACASTPSTCRTSRTPTASPSPCRTGSSGETLRDPREVPDRRRRRALEDRRRTSACRWRAQMDWAGSMNIVFHADLSKYVAHRPERPVLDHAAGRATSAASAWASCAWCGRGTSG